MSGNQEVVRQPLIKVRSFCQRMVKQTRQEGYLFKFDKVNATASLIFSHPMIFSSGASLAYLDKPVDYADEEGIIRFLPVHYTITVKEA